MLIHPLASHRRGHQCKGLAARAHEGSLARPRALSSALGLLCERLYLEERCVHLLEAGALLGYAGLLAPFGAETHIPGVLSPWVFFLPQCPAHTFWSPRHI